MGKIENDILLKIVYAVKRIFPTFIKSEQITSDGNTQALTIPVYYNRLKRWLHHNNVPTMYDTRVGNK